MTSRFKINNPRNDRLYPKESTVIATGKPGILNPIGQPRIVYSVSNYANVLIVLFSCVLGIIITNHISQKVNQKYWIKKIVLKNRQIRNSERAALYMLSKEDNTRFLGIYRRLKSQKKIKSAEYQEVITSLNEILENRPKNIMVNRTLALTLLEVCDRYNQLCLNSRDYINYTLYLEDYSDIELCDELTRLDAKIASL